MLCPAFLRKFGCQPLCCVPLEIQTFFIKILSSSLNNVPCWLLTNTAVMIFWCHKLIAKINNQKNSDMKNFICNQYGERHPILSAENIQICREITKLEAIRMQYACIFLHIGWISAEIWIFIFARYCSNIPKVKWAMSYRFCRKFYTISSSAEILGNRLRFDKDTESLKVGTWDTV